MTTLFGRNLDDDRPHLGPGLPYVLVEIDPAWRVPGDVHPNASAAQLIAAAIAARLDGP